MSKGAEQHFQYFHSEQINSTDLLGVLARLNDQQRAAVTHGDSPLLIVAGAGTGKTTTLAHRVAYKIATGARPNRLLLLTFTRRAAAQMLHRADAILAELRTSAANGWQTSGKVWGGTFHAVATRLLRLYGRSIGLDPSFTILDRADAEDLMGLIRAELGLAKTSRRFPLKSTCLDIYSRCVNARESVEQAVRAHFPWCYEDVADLQRLFNAYVDRKEKQSVLDYDDLLLFWHGLLSNSRSSAAIRDRFDCVLVDEYQDTNRLQAEILEMLCPQGCGLTVVGDDAQAIYSFRAATVRNILDFPRQFPNATLITLKQNYRSIQPILDVANSVIAQASEHHAKQLWTQRQGPQRPQLVTCLDEDEQTDFIISQVLEHREEGLSLQRQAVLFRASHHSLALELELARRNIPFRKYGGLRFVETAHVKDLLAFLRLAENPRDTLAGMRVLTLLPGIGPKKAQQVLAVLGLEVGTLPGDPLPVPGLSAWRGLACPAPAAAPYWEPLQSLMVGLSGKEPGELAGQIHRIRLFYAPLAERLYDNYRGRLLDLEQLENLATRFSDRRRFLAEITLDPPAYTEDLAGAPLLDEDFLVLSTIHSAKGLEWDAVYIIHASDGNIPSDMATSSAEEIDEERRLFYVALTRAKDWLYVCHPLRYYSYPQNFRDMHGYSQLTRFLPPDVQSLFDHHTATSTEYPLGPADELTASTADGEDLNTEEIRRRLKDFF